MNLVKLCFWNSQKKKWKVKGKAGKGKAEKKEKLPKIKKKK